MELKVWCDGIQRVVCGVNSQTTCQDVVFALAHATAQTGRFILIERWHNSERLLAPSEHPLQVLSKWGEYANDVTFVMKRSENHSKTNANLSLSPQSSTPSSSSATSPQHMLTTAGGGVSSSPNRRDFLHLFNANNNSIYSSVNKKSSVFQQNSGSSSPSLNKQQMTSNTTNPNNSSNSTPNASPLKSNSCLNSSHNNTNSNPNNNTNNKTVIDSMATDLMANKQQMNNKNNNNSIELTPTKSSATPGNRPRHPPPYSEAISKSALISNACQTNNSLNSSSSHLLSPADTTCATNKRRSAEPSPQSQKQRTTGSQKELLLHRDAVRLVDLQKDTIVTQEKEMSSLEQQISSIENRLVKNENLVKRYKDEMEACHQLWLDQEVIIDQLGDQQRLEQELDQLMTSATTYEEDMMTLKKKLSKCETDIGDCRQNITKLMDQLEDDQRLVRDKAIDKEEKDRQSVEQLRIALRDKNQELESQKNDLQSLANSIKQLDSVLSEKSTEVDRLLADIKEANIQGLALQTANEKQRFNSNSSGQEFHRRSGSTRRIIGSPRELENAVATNKNPHGVWV